MESARREHEETRRELAQRRRTVKRLTKRRSRFGRILLLLSVTLMVSGWSFAQEVSEEEIERYKEIMTNQASFRR